MRSERERHARKQNRYNDVWWALRIGLGGTACLAGLDKFTNLICDWDKYLAPRVAKKLPVDARTFMKMVGVIEVAVGLGILLPPRTKLHAYTLAAWLSGIAGNLLLHEENYRDVAVRDLNLALGAYALGRLTGGRQGQMSLAESAEWLAEKTADVGRGLRVASERNGERMPKAA